jgi:hypothetical protein
MRQRLYRGHEYECDESQVDRAKFIAMALEIGPEESMGFAIEGFYILKPSRARNLLCKDAMQLGVDAMRLDRDGTSLRTAFSIGCEATSANAARTTRMIS